MKIASLSSPSGGFAAGPGTPDQGCDGGGAGGEGGKVRKMEEMMARTQAQLQGKK